MHKENSSSRCSSSEETQQLPSRLTMTCIQDKDQQRMVCTICGMLQENNSGKYCKFDYHQNKWQKRFRSLILNDQTDFEELDAGTYKVVQQSDSELLTAQEGEHSMDCICTKCMFCDEEQTFQNPYNQKWMMTNVQDEIRKFIETDGMEGMNLYDAQRLERKIRLTRISNPEIKVGEKLVEDTLANGKKVYSQPIVSQKSVELWMHWLPVVATKESLDSFNPELMKSMSKMGIMNLSNRWAQENWETFPWCETVKPKHLWNQICCNCNECGGCNHEFCKETLQKWYPLVFKSANPESLRSKRFNKVKHVLFTTRPIPEGYHVEWNSWKGTSFVKDEVEKPMKTIVSNYQINTMREHGIECPAWFDYQDAYEITGMIFKNEITRAVELVKSKVESWKHMSTHVKPYPNKYCDECGAWYIHREAQEDAFEHVQGEPFKMQSMPDCDMIIYDSEESELPRTPGTLCDPETGHLAFDEDGQLTYKRYNVGVVGVSKIPEWRVPFFKSAVERVLNDAVEAYGITHLTIVSGGANGVDSIVEDMCKARGIDFIAFPPEVESWQDQGSKKGYKTRDLEIVAKATCKVYNIVGATKEPKCYHCPGKLHWHSGGCWTMKQANNLGTSTELVEVA